MSIEHKVQELITRYEQELAEHEAGTLMSTGEMVHGTIWCKRILADLKTLL
jgi:hypothetical protein